MPTGTANNIALWLGVSGSLEEIVDGLSRSRPREVDVGIATGPWGRKRFLEAVGLGAFARTIRDADEEIDFAEDEYIKKLGAALGMKSSEYADLTLDYEMEDVASKLGTRSMPPAPPKK